MSAYRVELYLTGAEKKSPYLEWLKHLRDVQAKVAVVRRVARLEFGNFGDHKFCRDGVWELRIDMGPGYRVYYAHSGECLVLLLCAGDKRKQDADVQRAVESWQDWQRRNDDEE